MKETISADYLRQQKILHRDVNYGVASIAFGPIVADIVRKAHVQTLCDYGAGKQRLLNALRKEGVELTGYLPYDPVFPEYGPPQSADLVCCIDVLEHIEPELLQNVLFDLASVMPKLGFFSIHMGPAGKFLEDGRNAHLIQKPTSWWLPNLCLHFEVLQMQIHQVMGSGFWVIVKKKSEHVTVD